MEDNAHMYEYTMANSHKRQILFNHYITTNTDILYYHHTISTIP